MTVTIKEVSQRNDLFQQERDCISRFLKRLVVPKLKVNRQEQTKEIKPTHARSFHSVDMQQDYLSATLVRDWTFVACRHKKICSRLKKGVTPLTPKRSEEPSAEISKSTLLTSMKA